LKPIAIIQARMGSSRLPGKVLKPILGQPMLWHIVQRLRFVSELINVIVATSDQPENDPIRQFCAEENIPVFSGSENDVLDRFYQAALLYKGDPLLRITGDCPFVDPEIVSGLLSLYRTGEVDHAGIATGAGAIRLDGGRFPDGFDAECIRFTALEKAWREATEILDREHVTPYIWRNKGIFRCEVLKSKKDYLQLRLTVDNEEDLKLVSRIYEALYNPKRPFSMNDILVYLSAHPELAGLNQSFIGKEGYQKLWNIKDHWP
jgi:spore coat polysaccharide biosynthesis protein SpsF